MKAEIESPYNVKEVKFQRHYPGYFYRREVVDDSDYGGNGKLEMVNCYSDYSGYWIGGARTARFLCKKGGILKITKARPGHSVCSIGKNEEEQKWYGWSHRAICGFGIGDRIYEERFGNDHTLFTEHGRKTILHWGMFAGKLAPPGRLHEDVRYDLRPIEFLEPPEGT